MVAGFTTQSGERLGDGSGASTLFVCLPAQSSRWACHLVWCLTGSPSGEYSYSSGPDTHLVEVTNVCVYVECCGGATYPDYVADGGGASGCNACGGVLEHHTVVRRDV